MQNNNCSLCFRNTPITDIHSWFFFFLKGVNQHEIQGPSAKQEVYVFISHCYLYRDCCGEVMIEAVRIMGAPSPQSSGKAPQSFAICCFAPCWVGPFAKEFRIIPLALSIFSIIHALILSSNFVSFGGRTSSSKSLLICLSFVIHFINCIHQLEEVHSSSYIKPL